MTQHECGPGADRHIITCLSTQNHLCDSSHSGCLQDYIFPSWHTHTHARLDQCLPFDSSSCFVTCFQHVVRFILCNCCMISVTHRCCPSPALQSTSVTVSDLFSSFSFTLASLERSQQSLRLLSFFFHENVIMYLRSCCVSEGRIPGVLEKMEVVLSSIYKPSLFNWTETFVLGIITE